MLERGASSHRQLPESCKKKSYYTAPGFAQKEAHKLMLEELNRKTRFDNKLKTEVRAVESIVRNRQNLNRSTLSAKGHANRVASVESISQDRSYYTKKSPSKFNLKKRDLST
jgi:hypothetical protein